MHVEIAKCAHKIWRKSEKYVPKYAARISSMSS